MESKTEYKSPKHKLLSFFENSRNQWREKTKEGKKTIHLLKKKVNYLEQSRVNWKKENQELKIELNNTKLKRNNLQKEIEALKKKQ